MLLDLHMSVSVCYNLCSREFSFAFVDGCKSDSDLGWFQIDSFRNRLEHVDADGILEFHTDTVETACYRDGILACRKVCGTADAEHTGLFVYHETFCFVRHAVAGDSDYLEVRRLAAMVGRSDVDVGSRADFADSRVEKGVGGVRGKSFGVARSHCYGQAAYDCYR